MDDSLSTAVPAAAEAFLSGRAGCAIIQSAGSFFRISIDEIKPTPCDATYWSHLRGLHPDGVVLKVGPYPFPEVQKALRSSWQRDRVLSLTLIALDADHNSELRKRACSAAETLMAEPDPGAFLRLRLLSRVSPPGADFEGAERLAEQASARRMSQLFAEVSASRSAIAVVRAAWDRIVRELPTPADRVEAMQVVERAGAAARLVVAVREGMPHEERSALTQWFIATVAPTLRVPQPLVLLNRWLSEVAPKGVRQYPDTQPVAALWVHDVDVGETSYSRSSKEKPK